ncbi:MAG: glycosyltransferase family 1 protein [Bacteroidota bacterium]|nr:glycosyltransferase family 1 protein [Bacteroidota bacterium]
MAKRILIDLERLRYPNSGLANVFRNIAKGIEEHTHSDVQVRYFGPQEELSKTVPSAKIIAYKKWHKFFECFSHKFNLIHISYQHSWYFTKKYKHSIKVLTLHDLNFLHENLSSSKKKKLLNRINKSFETADYIVCISEFVRQDLLKNKHLFNFKRLKDIVVIYNGIELPESRNYLLGRYDFLRSKKYILNIGVFLDKKNQKSLIEMLPYLDEDLVLITSEEKEPYASALKQRITELNLQNRVHIFRNVSEEEKYALIQHCQAMCHPSIAEGFGIPPIEAMAFGKPVFLSKKTSLPEIGGEVAFYFENFNPVEMATLLKEKMVFYQANQSELETKIKKWASQFDYKVMAHKYLELYMNVLADKQ